MAEECRPRGPRRADRGGRTFLYRKTDARSLTWLLLGWLLIASIGGMVLALLTFVVGVPLG
ncbi:hypothetical protein CFB34_015125 [Burkholderia sp. HI4860]|uniref:hypothetical protein n=1 Tax=Burkholderia sp. HI4860 TaxID=2015361 RepID=UPI001F61ABD9|nr:hypothetical protein [Burkholderia sp. HI4860]MCI3970359.1 hypothetical protein [Burkholderia sp. HI4860]